MSLMKHVLRSDASSARNGGTRRVFTSPLRGAFTMTANAYRPAWGDESDTHTSLRTTAPEGVLSASAASFGRCKRSMANILQYRLR